MYEISKDWVKHIPFSAWFILAYPIFMALFMRPRDLEEYIAIDFSAKVQIIFLSVGAFWALNRIVQLNRSFLHLLLRAPLSYLFAYMLLGLTSVLWSSHPVMTLYRSIEGLVFLVLIIDCVHSSRNNVESLQILIMFCLIACLCDISRGVQSGLTFGRSDLLEFHHCIHSSPLAAAGVFISLGSPNRVIRLWVTAVFVLIVMLSTSSSTYIAFLTGIGALFLLRRHFLYAFVFIFLSLAILLLFIYSGAQSFTRILFVEKTPEQITTLTGRTDIWHWSWEERISKRLVLGYGYDVGEHKVDDTASIKHSKAHNVVVSAAICLGIPGLLLICSLCASMLRNALLTRNSLSPYLFVACLVVWINSLTSASIASRISVIWILTAWLCVIITDNRNLICSNRPHKRQFV